MTIVNINKDWYYLDTLNNFKYNSDCIASSSSSSSTTTTTAETQYYVIEGKLKTICDDFEVREIPLSIEGNSELIPADIRCFDGINVDNLFNNDIDDDVDDDNNNNNNNNNNNSNNNKKIKKHDDKIEVLFELNSYLTSDMMSNLDNMNNSVINKTTNDYKNPIIIVSSSFSSDIRKKIHTAIKELFPFLTSIAVTNDSNIQDNINVKDVSIHVSIDSAMIELYFDGILSGADLITLQIFRTRGPSHPLAGQGIRIGLDMTREHRTIFYRKLQSTNRSLDSKTIDQGSSKIMLIYWKIKTLRSVQDNNRKKLNISSGNTNKSSNSNGDIHLGFILLKRNTEHNHAIQKLSEAVGNISLAAIGYAGIKDKRATTYQHCSMSIKKSFNRNSNQLEEQNVDLNKKRMRESNQQHLSYINNIITSLLALSNWNWNEKGTSGIAISDIKLLSAPLTVGELWGNNFNIVIRNIAVKELDKDIDIGIDINKEKILNHLKKSIVTIENQGFPNFFGSQRMGVLRDNNNNNNNIEKDMDVNIVDVDIGKEDMLTGPNIGKLLVRGDLKVAIETILLGDINEINNIRDQSPITIARRMYMQGSSLKEVLSALPNSSIREKALVKGMIRYGWERNSIIIDKSDILDGSIANSKLIINEKVLAEKDNIYMRILEQIPYSARSMWISSYQSWIWNKVASKRLELYGNKPIIGDLIFDKHTLIISYLENEEDLNKISIKDVVLPLFGTSMILPQNSIGQYYLSILKSEKLISDDIELNKENKLLLRVSLFHPRGAYRNILKYVYNTSITECIDEYNKNVSQSIFDIKISFSLESGCYATAFLRELFHNNKFI